MIGQTPDTSTRKPKPSNGVPAKKSAAKKQRGRKNDTASKVIAFIIVLLLFYVLIIMLAAGFIYYSFNQTAKNTEIYSLRVVNDERTLHTVTAETANNEYGLYIPFSYLSEIGSFGLAGNGDDISLFIIGTDNRIKCRINSSLIEINGNPVRISAPIMQRESDGEYIIPVVLLENYINGIDVTYNDENMICYVQADPNNTGVALTLLLPQPMEKSYFPESYKTYRPTDESE